MKNLKKVAVFSVLTNGATISIKRTLAIMIEKE